MTKFVDDTTMVGLISCINERAFKKEVSSLVECCSINNLEQNINKTKEPVVDCKNKGELQPLVITSQEVERVDHFKFHGTTISSSLKWEDNVTNIQKKAHQRLFFLRQLWKLGALRGMMLQFYWAIIESLLTLSVIVWYGNFTAHAIKLLDRDMCTASKRIGCKFTTISELYHPWLLNRCIAFLGITAIFINCPSILRGEK